MRLGGSNLTTAAYARLMRAPRVGDVAYWNAAQVSGLMSTPGHATQIESSSNAPNVAPSTEARGSRLKAASSARLSFSNPISTISLPSTNDFSAFGRC